jgi:hypothetical protein
MKINIKEVKSIGLNYKLPRGFRFIESWEVEWLLCNNFKIFDGLEKHRYYKIINNHRYLWLGGLDSVSQVLSRYLGLYGSNRACGVLICKK